MNSNQVLSVNINFENKSKEERSLILRRISNVITDICEEECIEVLVEEACLNCEAGK